MIKGVALKKQVPILENSYDYLARSRKPAERFFFLNQRPDSQTSPTRTRRGVPVVGVGVNPTKKLRLKAFSIGDPIATAGR